jgi:hypothetical protein
MCMPSYRSIYADVNKRRLTSVTGTVSVLQTGLANSLLVRAEMMLSLPVNPTSLKVESAPDQGLITPFLLLNGFRRTGY